MSRMSWFGRMLAVLGLVLAPRPLVAQQETGRLVGRVVEVVRVAFIDRLRHCRDCRGSDHAAIRV